MDRVREIRRRVVKGDICSRDRDRGIGKKCHVKFFNRCLKARRDCKGRLVLKSGRKGVSKRYSLIRGRGLKLLRCSITNKPVHKLFCFGVEGAVRCKDKGDDQRRRRDVTLLAPLDELISAGRHAYHSSHVGLSPVAPPQCSSAPQRR